MLRHNSRVKSSSPGVTCDSDLGRLKSIETRDLIAGISQQLLVVKVLGKGSKFNQDCFLQSVCVQRCRLSEESEKRTTFNSATF
jgi:hypothetical protein